MFGSLLVVVGLILLLFYLSRRLRLRGSSHSSHIPQMRLLGTLNIAPKRALALVEFSDKWLIVGIGAENISLITTMDRPPSTLQAQDVLGKGTGFHDFLPGAGIRTPWNKNRETSSTDDASQ
jgi:flagellar biosynthetic protein FliO